MSRLVIAEKPSVAKAISPVLGATATKQGYIEGGGYIVSWCFGHLVGLALPDGYGEKWSGKWSFDQLPMIPDKWQFRISEGAAKQYAVLKSLMNSGDVTEIICATDADREGECIFRYVYQLAGCKKPVKRLWVSSLEETAIKDGFGKLRPMSDYDSLFAAGYCRAKADWIVGMNGSRLFSVRYNSTLNTGRVQTPTLSMIVKRDGEVENFVKQKYFTADINCGEFSASSERIDSEVEVGEIVGRVNGKAATITEVKREIKTVNPPKLFDLTTLQREANKRYGYTAQQTLDYLQALYEGKLATYPRTDSQFIPDDMEQTAAEVVSCIYSAFSEIKNIGEPNIKRCINNSKVTGHHAILPTVNIRSADLSALPQGQRNILLLISARVIAAAASPHKYEAVKITLECEGVTFTAKGRSIVEIGWKAVEGKEDGDKEIMLPTVAEGDIFNVSAEKGEHFTSPPKPYTEDTLLSAMEHAGAEDFDENAEKKGLGTPATRAGTIENLVARGYAKREGKKIISTDKGRALIGVVPDEIKSVKLTADWENQLALVERDEMSAEDFMSGINKFITELCGNYGTVADNAALGKSEISGKCPKCGAEIRSGKFGFYCVGKCGMQIGKVFGKSLTAAQLGRLLGGESVTYSANGKKTTVLPEAEPFSYNGKDGKKHSGYQWKTKKG